MYAGVQNHMRDTACVPDIVDICFFNEEINHKAASLRRGLVAIDCL